MYYRKAFPYLAVIGALTVGTPAFAHSGSHMADSPPTPDNAGTQVDLQYSYEKQNQLRSGSKKVAPAGEPDTEDDLSTVSRITLLTVDHSFNTVWGVALQIPFVNRTHSLMNNNTAEVESWRVSGVGDIRVVGRYQFYTSADGYRSAGIRAGVKLANGSIDKRNDNGDLGERGIQPGTGSENLIVAAYYNNDNQNTKLNWFAQTTYEAPVSSKDGFSPGAEFGVSAGLRYPTTVHLSATLQGSATARGRDSGINADPDNSGSRQVVIGPGFVYSVTKNFGFYGSVQLPVYQSVNGVQLTPDWSAAIGLSFRL